MSVKSPNWDDPDDPFGDGGGGDDDPENACTCGACCSCKCTCGLWSAEVCSGTYWHYGHGDNPMPPEVAGGYCECHHQDEDEPYCEHHAAIQDAAERAADASESMDDKLDGIENELSGINDKLTVTDPGNLTLPSLGGGVDVPLPSVPGVSVPSLSLPEAGELPNFYYAKLFGELSAEVEDKFGLQSLSNTLVRRWHRKFPQRWYKTLLQKMEL